MRRTIGRLGVLTLLAATTVIGVIPASPASAAWSRRCDFRADTWNAGRNSYIVPEGGGFLGKSPEEVCQVGKSRLIMQSDGNLVLYNENGGVSYSANTYSWWWWEAPGDHAIFQSDGNFVVYDYAGRAKWATNTAGHCGGSTQCVLAIQGDGNLVIYDTSGSWTPIWATNTAH